MTILIVGATGTLGRQIVQVGLDRGYKVRCLTRNMRKAKFLRNWGAEVIYGDLAIPETLPRIFKGISVVIDASTLRPEEENANVQEIDLISKLALIKAAKIANVERFIFFSLMDTSNKTIPLVQFKTKIENLLTKVQLPYTIFKVSGFYQGLVGQYGVPLLDKQKIWLINETSPISYIDAQDVAFLVIQSLLIANTRNKSLALNGPQPLFSNEIIQLCETLAGQKAEIGKISKNLLKFLNFILSSSMWFWSTRDRLNFFEIAIKPLDVNSRKNFTSYESFKILQSKPSNLLTLNDYFQEYFEVMLIRLRDLNYNQAQRNKRQNLIL